MVIHHIMETLMYTENQLLLMELMIMPVKKNTISMELTMDSQWISSSELEILLYKSQRWLHATSDSSHFTS